LKGSDVELCYCDQDRHGPKGRTTDELEKRSRFEELLAGLSATFINLPAGEVDSRIEEGLGKLGQALEMDLGTLLLLDPETGALRVTHEWALEVSAPGRGFRGTKVEDRFPWLAEKLQAGRPVLISQLADFPPQATSERQACEELGICSVLWVPIHLKHSLRGFVAFNTLHQETVWSAEIVQRLQLEFRTPAFDFRTLT
jgi:transcriptional regulator with GAF, ATPase, and Fis domain